MKSSVLCAAVAFFCASAMEAKMFRGSLARQSDVMKGIPEPEERELEPDEDSPTGDMVARGILGEVNQPRAEGTPSAERESADLARAMACRGPHCRWRKGGFLPIYCI